MSGKALQFLVGVAVVASAAGCSSSGNSSGTATSGTTAPVLSVRTSSSQASPPMSAPAATSPAATSSAASGELSGTWRGHYGGAYSGTFDLRWQQSGAKLSGTIHISAPDDTLPINGTLRGNTISFGTVGSLAITYSGSVSGDSMSGSYQVHAGGAANGGPWSASKA